MRTPILALLLLWAGPGLAHQPPADEAAPAEASAARESTEKSTSPHKAESEEHGIRVSIGADEDELDLPDAVVEKLSADQLVRLIESRQRGDPQGVFAAVAFFTCVILVVLTWLYFRTRRDRLLHETLQKMIEKGVEIPAELIVKPRAVNVDLRRGLVLSGAGIGLMTMIGLSSADPGVWAVGLIVALMGVGYLIAWWITKRERNGVTS